MRTRTDRGQRNNSLAIANSTSLKNSTTALSFADNRPSAIAQRAFQNMAERSTRSSKAAKFQELANTGTVQTPHNPTLAQPIQRLIRIKDGALLGEYDTAGGKDTTSLINKVDKLLGVGLKRGWKVYIKRLAGDDDKKYKFVNTEHFLKVLSKRFKPLPSLKKKKIRPNFPTASYDLGRVTLGLQTGKDQSGFSPSDNDGALPHRFPYAAIQESTKKFIDGAETSGTLIRWSDRLKTATEERLEINKAKLKHDPNEQKLYEFKVQFQIGQFNTARKQLIASKALGQSLQLDSPVVQTFLKWTNALHGNIPDYGPHTKVNIPVSNRLHLHFEGGRLTPGSKAAGSMTPSRSKGLAMTDDGGSIVTTDGYAKKYSSLDPNDKLILDKQKKSNTTIKEKDLTGPGF